MVAELSSAAAAAIAFYVVAGVVAVAVIITLAVYRYYRHNQKLEEKRLELTERAHEREHYRILTQSGMFDTPELPVSRQREG